MSSNSTDVDGKAVGTQFWNDTFQSQSSVDFTTFATGLAAYFNRVEQAPLYTNDGIDSNDTSGGYSNSPAISSLPCLLNAALAATGATTTASDGNGQLVISRDAFNLFLARFGGDKKYSTKTAVRESVRNLFHYDNAQANISAPVDSLGMSHQSVDIGNAASLVGWLHSSADVGSNVDSMILDSARNSQGTFIIRFSSSRPEKLAMDFVEPYGTKTKKILIDRSGDGWIKSGGRTVHPTLHALVQHHTTQNGTWIVSALSKRFKGSNQSPSNQTQTAHSTNSSVYATGGIDSSLQGMHISPNNPYATNTSIDSIAHASSNLYASNPMNDMSSSSHFQSGAGGYAASFDMPTAPPTLQSGYSGCFVEGDDSSQSSSSQSDLLARQSSIPSPITPPPISTRTFFYAIFVGDLLSISSYCSSHNGCGVTDSFGLSALHIACAANQPEALELLRNHVPEHLRRANVTRAISTQDGKELSAYNWENRFMPYWPPKEFKQELDIWSAKQIDLDIAILFHTESFSTNY